ncbi:putative G-protein coupled receptor-associated protein LMBRD2B [Nannochloris sp. 'desiccata']|nr:putative G-protein coupled receptor-associated protein LMBRD2B [Chlorella desiccata (nom. nud.)]
MALFAFYAVCMVGAALLSVMLLRRYADPFRVSLLVLLVAGYSWLTSLSVVALVPVDAFTTLLGTENHIHAITILWKISYWSTQALTWAIIPIIQGYVLSGSFTVSGRLKSAARRLWRFWIIVGVLAIAGILFAAAWGKLHIDTLPQLIVLLSNTYGLVAVVALLGYGLVEVPRVMWRRSFPESRLTWHLHRVGRAAVRLEDASKELERCLAVVIITSQQVPRSDPELRKIADSLVSYADTHSPVPLAALAASKVDVEALEENDLDYATNAAGLARLRGRVKLAIAEFVGSRGDYLSFVNKAMELESICKSRQLGVYLPPDGQSTWVAMAEWQYKCTVRPYVQRFSALFLAGLSITIVWCEATIGSGRHPDLSPFSLAIHKHAILDSPWSAQLLIALPLAYCCTAMYFSLFKLGSLGAYHMVPRATWSWSLLLNGSLLARFAAPLAFNYLHVIRMTGGQRGSRHMVFVELMAMEDVPLLGAGFNTWFPLIMVAYVAILTFDVCGACAARICNSSLVKFLLPARLRLNGERPEEESIGKGQRCIAAEHDAVRSGGELGEGTELFGMLKHVAGRAAGAGRQQRRYTGGPGGTSSAAGVSGSYRREIELGEGGGSGGSSLKSDGVASGAGGSNVRQPLFGGSHIRSDYPASGSNGGADAADELFAGVGGRSPTPKRNGRNPWD